MKQLQALYTLILISIITSSTEALDYAKKGCSDTCGSVMIPYPFGIGTNCSVNKWYTVDCNSSKPYLSAFSNMQVFEISLEEQTVNVKVPIISSCQNSLGNRSYIPSIDLRESPFAFSGSDNMLIVEGCGHATIWSDGLAISGCSSTCTNDSTLNRTGCFGLSCCQAKIPYNLQSYSLNLTGLESLGEDGVCVSAFLALGIEYDARHMKTKNISFVPVSLKWFLTDHDFQEIPQCWAKETTYNIPGGFSKHKTCSCGKGREGNPYLHYQCEESEECRRCRDSGGICEYIENPDDFESPGWLDCGRPVHRPRIYIIISISCFIIGGILGLLLLAMLISKLYELYKKFKAKRQEKRFFERHNRLLLKQQEATKLDLVDKIIYFTSKELETATEHFNENRILGQGGQGTVYKGMLSDGRIVAVKKPKIVVESQLEQLINEVVILSQVNHRNVVKLLGCCLETDVPLLVSEFVSKGTLYDYIQDDTSELPFSLNMRLQIATEVAGALSYLHSATSIPVYHRDIKTTNILLDEECRAKVSDFGTSRLVSIDQTHLTTLVKGTFGYFDPEYFQSSQFTEKSDVYSFGVVLLELFTREKPISFARFGEHMNLATYFIFSMEEGRAMSIFDPMVVNEDSKGVVLEIANLAMRCLNSNGRHRPTMKEVAMELEGMRMSDPPSVVQTSLGHANHNEDLTMFTYDESTSTTVSFKDCIIA